MHFVFFSDSASASHFGFSTLSSVFVHKISLSLFAAAIKPQHHYLVLRSSADLIFAIGKIASHQAITKTNKVQGNKFIEQQ